MIQAKLTSKGQITIPKEIRTRLNLHAGDRVTFIISREGKVMLTTQTLSLDDIFGMFNHKSKGRLTQKDIHAAIAKRMRRKYK